jgi:hypothetical protein
MQSRNTLSEEMIDPDLLPALRNRLRELQADALANLATAERYPPYTGPLSW